MTFQQKLDSIVKKNNSLLCVGLDSSTPPQFDFNKTIIDATHDLVCAYKPNLAFYEARGEAGWHDLKLTINYLQKNHPDIVTIADAKRADIGSTNTQYATAIFDDLGFDAITLHPYLGRQALKPFLDKYDKGCIILCRTSNPDAKEIQDLEVNGKPLYLTIAHKVSRHWNENNNCLLVVGATYPKELAQIRKIAPEMTFLVPGIGAQGGHIAKTLKAGLNSTGSGLIINSSRGIIFADNPRQVAKNLKNQINKYR